MSSKFGGRTPVRVHFMDNSSKMFLLDDTVLVRDVVVMVVEKLGISDGNPLAVAPYFGIYECPDGSTISNALAPESVLVETVQSWSSAGFKLVFMIRLYMPTMWGIEYRDAVAQRLDKPISMLSDEVRRARSCVLCLMSNTSCVIHMMCSMRYVVCNMN